MIVISFFFLNSSILLIYSFIFQFLRMIRLNSQRTFFRFGLDNIILFISTLISKPFLTLNYFFHYLSRIFWATSRTSMNFNLISLSFIKLTIKLLFGQNRNLIWGSIPFLLTFITISSTISFLSRLAFSFRLFRGVSTFFIE